MSCGILIAADHSCEWLIPWFYERLRSISRLPLVIVDMGMSLGALSFCRDRAEVIPLEIDQLPSLSAQLEGWYKKPFAFLQTPFEKTLWLDCDCEVVRPIDLLFELEGEVYLSPDTENSHLKERELGRIRQGEVLYNSGVVLYGQHCPLIQQWAKVVSEEQGRFFSDQHVLSRLIDDGLHPVHALPDVYNWRMSQGFNIHAVIIHWAGSWGKNYIRMHGGLTQELASLPVF